MVVQALFPCQASCHGRGSAASVFVVTLLQFLDPAWPESQRPQVLQTRVVTWGVRRAVLVPSDLTVCVVAYPSITVHVQKEDPRGLALWLLWVKPPPVTPGLRVPLGRPWEFSLLPGSPPGLLALGPYILAHGVAEEQFSFWEGRPRPDPRVGGGDQGSRRLLDRLGLAPSRSCHGCLGYRASITLSSPHRPSPAQPLTLRPGPSRDCSSWVPWKRFPGTRSGLPHWQRVAAGEGRTPGYLQGWVPLVGETSCLLLLPPKLPMGQDVERVLPPSNPSSSFF